MLHLSEDIASANERMHAVEKSVMESHPEYHANERSGQSSERDFLMMHARALFHAHIYTSSDRRHKA